jgi:hypothetical protein
MASKVKVRLAGASEFIVLNTIFILRLLESGSPSTVTPRRLALSS